ncbi:MAG TPA: AgmX/PglI C-terminal domain-containing protein [Polyangia bacterium]|nr:AgmX/PglI C-terminal domain-containing protein [Polyangia bacterium]
MNESTRGYKVVIALLLAALAITVGLLITKSGGNDEQMARLNKLASDLEDCRKIRGEQKDRIAQLEADLKKAQEQANAPNVVNGGAITANVKMDGGPALPMDQVQKIIRNNTGGLKSCYERALKRDTGLQLSPIHITFRFYIHPTGATGETSLASDTHIDQQLIDCFKSAVGRWKFPSFGGQPMYIELPLPFQPVGGNK